MSVFDVWHARVAARGWHEPDVFNGYRLPETSRFAPTKTTLDPDVFQPNGQMRTDFRETILGTLSAFWEPRYGDWRPWAHVYLAGSLASYWWGKPDVDILIGIDHVRFERDHPEFRGMDNVALCHYLTDELKRDLDPETDPFTFPNSGLVDVEVTWYCNPLSYDIRNIKPYAAYSIDEDRWIVHPPIMGKNWGPHQFNHLFWTKMTALADHLKAILALPQPERGRQATEAFNALHDGRSAAYGPHGTGLFDQRSIAWTLMGEWGLVGQLLEAMKHTGAIHEADQPYGGGFEFRFRAAQPKSMDAQRDHLLMHHKLQAIHTKSGREAGWLYWHHGTGEISNIQVHDPFQRQGLATEMLSQARDIAANTRGVKPPKHSPDRTDAGEAWARSLNERLPRRQRD